MKRLLMIFSQVTSVLSAYKLRTAIAVIGVLLGAMALVIVQNVSVALQAKVEEDIRIFGDRVFTVFARVPFTPGQMMRRERIKSMKLEDVEAILTVNNVEQAAPSVRRSISAKYTNTTISAALIGTTADYMDMKGLSIADGRVFDDIERQEREKVAIIGSEVAGDLFGNVSPLGETIYLGTMTFTVIGVLHEKGSDPNGNSMDNIIIIPVETALSRVFNRDYLSDIIVRVRSWDDYETVASDVSLVLRQQHRLSAERKNDFDIVNPIEEQEMSNTLMRLATTLGSASAVVAFLIGAIGIFSLMLLIVNQRITEIGIKRAIGATKKDILMQFMLESGYIGVMGGVFGIIIGTAISLGVSYFAGLPYVVSFLGIGVGFTASLAAGLLAGLYPASRASRVVPVKALRL